MTTFAFRKLLVATTNQKKLSELKTLLSDLPFDLICLNDLSGYQEVLEEGATFSENACLKALGYAKQTGFLTLAEDSGLCCEALGGAPGVYSARFAGEEKSDEENNRKLLSLLADVADDKRSAYFCSAVAVAEPERLVGSVEGTVQGLVNRQVLGSNGFGYDPVFYYPPYGTTFGMVTAEEKHRVSHRAQALQKAKELLKNYMRETRR